MVGMKYTIKNPLNSPYNVTGEDGQVHVPARGEVTAEFSDMQIQAIRSVGYFEVSEGGSKKRDPLDHDGDGVKGGFVQEVNAPDEPVKEPAENEHVEPKRRGRPRRDA